MIAAKRVRTTGAILLVTGLLAAVVIFFGTPTDEQQQVGILGVEVATRQENLQLEKMGGKSYLLYSELSEWFTSMWHGRRLAYTVGVLSFAGFVACRRLADLLEPASNEP